MKKEIRVIGIDDSPFKKFAKDKRVLIIGTIFRGGSWLDGVLSTSVGIDGNDSTSKVVQMINKCKFKPQLQCIFLNGIAFGGIKPSSLSASFSILCKTPTVSFLLHLGQMSFNAMLSFGDKETLHKRWPVKWYLP